MNRPTAQGKAGAFDDPAAALQEHPPSPSASPSPSPSQLWTTLCAVTLVPGFYGLMCYE